MKKKARHIKTLIISKMTHLM